MRNLVLLLVMFVGLVGCGDNNGTSDLEEAFTPLVQALENEDQDGVEKAVNTLADCTREQKRNLVGNRIFPLLLGPSDAKDDLCVLNSTTTVTSIKVKTEKTQSLFPRVVTDNKTLCKWRVSKKPHNLSDTQYIDTYICTPGE